MVLIEQFAYKAGSDSGSHHNININIGIAIFDIRF